MHFYSSKSGVVICRVSTTVHRIGNEKSSEASKDEGRSGRSGVTLGNKRFHMM